MAPGAIIERAEELASLEATLSAARGGAGRTVVLEGPAGIGKTSLVAAARARAAEGGMTVLRAHGSPLEREYAMWVVRQCFDPALRAAPRCEDLLAGAAQLAVLDVPDDEGVPPVGVLHGPYRSRPTSPSAARCS